MQVLERQKQKDLSIEQIIPDWSKTLAKGKKLDDHAKRDMENLAHCVVGEAHGRTDGYYTNAMKYCPDCISFSMEIPYEYKAMTRMNSRGDYFDRTMREFKDHYNEKHKEEYYSRMNKTTASKV